MPVPDVVIVPGYLVNIHMPIAGKPSRKTLPVDTVHVGGVIVPTNGAIGISGCGFIRTLVDTPEVHPDELVTVKKYVPGTIPERVVLVAEPIIPPGLIVQVPDGKPLSTTLPVPDIQVGCVIVPTTGGDGFDGCVLITTFADDPDVQSFALVTVKLYVPALRPVMVVLVPVPVLVTEPGFRVNVHVPLEGRPYNTMLPVATEHIG